MTDELILKDIPMPIRTPRLTLRVPAAGTGQAVYDAIQESLPELQEWMRWAHKSRNAKETELNMRKKSAAFILREELMMLVFDKNDRLIGASGFHMSKSETPVMSIGYWIRTSERGKGYVTEWVNALTRYAFEELKLKKVMIDINADNASSIAVVQRLGYQLEYISRWGIRKPGTDEEQQLHVYSRFDIDNLPPLDVSW